MMIKSMTAQPCFLIHLFHKHPKIYFCLFSAVLYHIMILWNMLSTCSDNDTGNIQTSRHFARPYYFAVFSFPTMLNINVLLTFNCSHLNILPSFMSSINRLLLIPFPSAATHMLLTRHPFILKK